MASAATVQYPITAKKGGTGQSSYTTGDVLIATGASTLSKVGPGAAGSIMRSNGAGAAPTYGALDLSDSDARTGTLPATNGGSGQSTYTTGDTLYSNSSNSVAKLPAGTNGQVYQQVNGVPSWQWSDFPNFILNSGFDYWQRGTSTTVANSATAYLADRWYVHNQLGTNGVITYSRQNAGSSGAVLYGLKAQITTAPTASHTNGLSINHSFDNPTMLRLYNRTVSFAVQVKSFGNVNSASLVLAYMTSEGKVTNASGTTISSTTCSVNTSTFTECKLEGVALGTSVTSSGSYGLLLRINNVSSGNTYDLNNGLQVELPMLNLGVVANPWTRSYISPEAELEGLQRFYQKSYALTSNPGSAVQPGARRFVPGDSGAGGADSVIFPVRMRAVPTCVIYSTATGASGNIRNASAAADAAGSVNLTGEGNFSPATSASATSGQVYEYQWACDAEI